MRVAEQIKDGMTNIVSVVLGIAVLILVMTLSFAIEFFPQLLIALFLAWLISRL